MASTKWSVDLAHSSIEFSVRHLMIAKVKGSFEKFDADVQLDTDDLPTATATFTIEAASINTRNAERDAHLRSADFFETDTFGSVSFVTTNFVKTGANTYDVTGNLTIRGVTRPETFALVFEGVAKDFSGNVKAGFSGTGKISRTDYGLNWNAALETGGVLVGEEVNISFEIQLVKQA